MAGQRQGSDGATSCNCKLLSQDDRAQSNCCLPVSAIFAIIAGALVILTPESRTVAADVVAAAFLVLAAGIAGFTRLRASAPGIKIDTDQRLACTRFG